jgi:hypothetical protein
MNPVNLDRVVKGILAFIFSGLVIMVNYQRRQRS